MITEFKFPDVGEGITEGVLVKWAVKVGEKIEEDQALAEIETAKAVVEMPSPRAGFVLTLGGKEGDEIKVGAVLVTIGDEEDQKVKEVKRESSTVVGVLEDADTDNARKEKAPHMGVLATPGLRRIARDMGIDITGVHGTGPHGRVTEDDLRKHNDVLPKMRRDGDELGDITRIPLTGIRKTIASNMPAYQQTAALVTHMDEADISELAIIKGKEENALKEREIKLTYLPFIIKAVVTALKEHPYLNSTLDDGRGEIVLKKYYHIGISVDTSDGLIVPVLRDADEKNIMQLAVEIQTLAERARNRTIDIKDLRGGTFSITNIGSYGGIFSTPIVSHPEAAILATGKIQEKPVALDGAIAVRKILPLSLAFDHRIMDGGKAARFMNTIIHLLEDPGLLLLELR